MKKLIWVLVVAAFFTACNNEKKDEAAAALTPESAATSEKPPVELLAPTAGDAVMASYKALESNNLDAYISIFDDNVKFRWSSGDSLVGKAAVKEFYAGRWAKIESLRFSDHILLPLMANASPNGGSTSSGKWVLSWMKVDAKYKNGNSITFWVHNAQHFNAADKIDESIQYMDRQPVMDASK